MSESLNIVSLSKEGKYQELIPQLEGLVFGEKDLTANLANISAALKQALNFFWIGFYLVKDDQLVLGPFQGPIACTRINKGKGVCGTSWEKETTLIVPNVDEFPGHIACSSLTKSEIVIPIVKNGKVIIILDADSDKFDDFDEIDKKYLEIVAQIIERLV